MRHNGGALCFIFKNTIQTQDMDCHQLNESVMRGVCFPSPVLRMHVGPTRDFVYDNQCTWCDQLPHYRPLPGSTQRDVSIPQKCSTVIFRFTVPLGTTKVTFSR